MLKYQVIYSHYKSIAKQVLQNLQNLGKLESLNLLDYLDVKFDVLEMHDIYFIEATQTVTS